MARLACIQRGWHAGRVDVSYNCSARSSTDECEYAAQLSVLGACALHRVVRRCALEACGVGAEAARLMESVKVNTGSAASSSGIVLYGGVSVRSSSKSQVVSAKWCSGSKHEQQADVLARFDSLQAGRKNLAGTMGFARTACFGREQELRSYIGNVWCQKSGTLAVAASQNTDAFREPSSSIKERERGGNGELFRGASRTSTDKVEQVGDSAEQGTITSYNGRNRQPLELPEEDSTDKGRRSRSKPKRQSLVRNKLTNYIQRRAGYAWLAAPLLSTAALTLPVLLVPLTSLLVSSYLVGLAATLVIDLLFVLSADIFLVLTNRTGHHQAVPGGPAPWIGPWDYTGYPQGFSHVQKYLSYAGVGIASSALVFSLFVGKFFVAFAVFVPYLSLIFVQVAYERLVYSDRLPVFPLVPILYTGYRFRQLIRGLEVVTAMSGSSVLAATLRLLIVVWTLYLAVHVTQLPWLYSTWNSNRAV